MSHLSGFRGCVVLALACLSTTLGCSAPELELMPRLQWTSFDGDFGAGLGEVEATSDIDSLGLGETEQTFAPRADLSFGPFVLSVDGMTTAFSGNGQLESTIVLDDQIFLADTPVRSAMDFDLVRATAVWDLIPGDLITAGIGLAAGLIDFKFDVESLETGARADIDETVPVPMLAGHVGVDLGPFDAGILVTGAALGIDDADASYFDLDASVQFEILDAGPMAVRIMGGYRAILIDAEFDDGRSDVELDVQLGGPYAGITVAF